MHSILNCFHAFFQRLYFHGKTIYTVFIKVVRVINLDHPLWTDRDFPHHRFFIVWFWVHRIPITRPDDRLRSKRALRQNCHDLYDQSEGHGCTNHLRIVDVIEGRKLESLWVTKALPKHLSQNGYGHILTHFVSFRFPFGLHFGIVFRNFGIHCSSIVSASIFHEFGNGFWFHLMFF